MKVNKLMRIYKEMGEEIEGGGGGGGWGVEGVVGYSFVEGVEKEGMKYGGVEFVVDWVKERVVGAEQTA